MKRLLIASLVLTQIFSSPAAAASLDDRPVANSRAGAFAGARLRITFGGPQAGKPRAGLALSAVNHMYAADGSVELRHSDGLELGVTEDRQVALSLAGRRLGAQDGEDEDEDDDGGIPTWAIVVGGVALSIGIGLAVLADAISDASE